MKKFKHIVWLLIAFLGVQNMQAQKVDVGLFESADNMLEVRVKPDSDFDGIVSNLLFTIRWRSDAGITMGNPIQAPEIASYAPLLKSGDVVQYGDYNYQVFFTTGMLPMRTLSQSWSAGDELVVMQIPVTSNRGYFELIEDQWTQKVESNGNYFCSLAGRNATGVIYQGAVDFCKGLSYTQTTQSPSCYGLSNGEIELNASGGNAPFDLLWADGSDQFDLTGLSAGIYRAILTDSRGCTKDVSIELNDAEMIIPEIEQNGDEIYTELPGTYQWYLNGTAIEGATGSSHKITTNGSYQVYVTTSAGCVARSEIIYLVLSGTNEIDRSYSINIYPNPSDGLFAFVFSTPMSDDYKIEIVNALGQVIQMEKLDKFSGKYEKEFDLRDSGKGMYSIRVTGTETKGAYKLVIE